MLTLTHVLLVLTLASLAVLGVYALVFFIALVLSFRAEKVSDAAIDRGREKGLPVDVLVPAHNEGKGLINCLESLVHQKYAGPITVKVLLKDFQDTAVPLLEKKFDLAFGQGAVRPKVLGNVTIEILATGQGPKRDRLNQVIPSLTSVYTAILDADHVADTGWIRGSVAKLEQDQTAHAVQAIRRPLSLSNLFQMWDSAQNHIGNELLNKLYRIFGQSTFFTGTSCLFRTATLKTHPFSDCITEDTDLSYDMVLRRERILHLADQGTREEVAPDFFSYIARRRRWSNGHNRTFFGHLWRIVASCPGFGTRIKLLLHGAFYLLPLLILVILFSQAIFQWLQFNRDARIVSAILTAIAASLLFLKVARVYRNWVVDLLVSFLWFFPQVVLIVPYVLKVFKPDLFFALVMFPYMKELLWVQLGFVLIPLLLMLSGLRFFRYFNVFQTVKLIVTYPVIVFLDIYAALLGLTDCIFGKNVWARVKRTHKKDEVIHRRFATPKSLAVTVAVLGVLPVSLLLLNDWSAGDECGIRRPVLGRTFFFDPGNPMTWNVGLQKTFRAEGDGGWLEIAFTNRLDAGDRVAQDLSLEVDGKAYDVDASGRAVTGILQEVGLGSSSYHLVLRGTLVKDGNERSFTCTQDVPVFSYHRELRGRDLVINDEPFLIKGVIPSFFTAAIDLSVQAGLNQIKRTGANVIRLYRPPSDEILRYAEQESLLIVDQPEDSTWDNTNVARTGAQATLVKNFFDLEEDVAKSPLILMHNLGNELELGREEDGIPGVKEIINRAKPRFPETLIGYSTYYTFINYAVDALGINMLDTGETYWGKALALMSRLNRPYYASEFGGFVAFYEKTDPLVQLDRMRTQWELLLQTRMMGAIFYESHDNWAQPVPVGYNDPFNNEQPDDNRGLWDAKNREKPLLQGLEAIYADVAVRVPPDVVYEVGQDVVLDVQNIRPYALRNVVVRSGGEALILDRRDLLPGDTGRITVPAHKVVPEQIWEMTYKTHHFLEQGSRVLVRLPVRNRRPVAVDNSVVTFDEGPGRLLAWTTTNESLDLYLPQGWRLISPVRIDNEGRHVIPLKKVIHPVELAVSREGRAFENWTTQSFEAGGRHYVRAKFEFDASDLSEQSFLVLSGTGEFKYKLRFSTRTYDLKGHNYRENVLPVKQFPELLAERAFVLEIDRQKIMYVHGKVHPFRENMWIGLEKPYILNFSKVEAVKSP